MDGVCLFAGRRDQLGLVGVIYFKFKICLEFETPVIRNGPGERNQGEIYTSTRTGCHKPMMGVINGL